MPVSAKKLLLVNPWIFDFAAYDYWTKPLGLLRIAAVLQSFGYDISLVDCLDRHHPALLNYLGHKQAKTKNDGSGHYVREQIVKPDVFSHIPRKYCRYGFPLAVVEQQLACFDRQPDLILVTSSMTYWYPGVRSMIELLRDFFPSAPIILGGIYSQLYPEHARSVCRPDFLCTSSGAAAVSFVLDVIGDRWPDRSVDEGRFASAYDLYPNLNSVAVTTSTGCPYRCSFCASDLLSKGYRRRPPDEVVDELSQWHERGVRHVAFFDDALLHRADEFFKPVLRGVLARCLNLNLHTPNGLPPKFVDKELAELLFRAGGSFIRLSFESSNSSRQKEMGGKVSNRELVAALDNLENAGFDRAMIGVYVLMGLADQDFAEVRDSVRFVRDQGALVNLASFSPIPGTGEWQKAVRYGLWYSGEDPLKANNTVFPLWSQKYGYKKCVDFVRGIKSGSPVV